MADNESRWVVAPGEARVDIAIGHEAKLSPELRDALENVARWRKTTRWPGTST